MAAKINWKNCLAICIIFLIFFSNISMAESENLYNLLNEKQDLLNKNLVIAKEKYPLLFSLIENQHLVIHTPDGQIVGLTLSNGKIVDVIQGEPEGATIDILTDMGTIESIKSSNDFMTAWYDNRIKVIFRNPISGKPIASSAALAGGAAVGTTVMIGAAASMSGGSILNGLSSYWKKLEEMVREFLKIGGKFSYEELEVKILSGLKREIKAKEFENKGELKGLFIACGAMFFAFALELHPFSHSFKVGAATSSCFNCFELFKDVNPFLFLLSIALFSIVAEIGHEFVIKLSLKNVGGKSVFELSLIGTIITIISGIFGFVISAAGGTKILHKFKKSKKDALVASSGSLFNLILGLFLLFIFFNIKWLALASAMPNLAYATFCLFPTYPFEGRRVFNGSKGLWSLLFLSSMFFYTFAIA